MEGEYLSVLDVTLLESRDEQTLKRAHRRKVLQWHPDKNAGRDTSSMFRLVREAYEYFQRRNKQLNAQERAERRTATRSNNNTQTSASNSTNRRRRQQQRQERFERSERYQRRTYNAYEVDEGIDDRDYEPIGSRARFDWFAHESGDVHSGEYQRTNAAAHQSLVNHRTGRTYNILVYVELSLQEVMHGCTRQIEYERTATCPFCTLETHTTCLQCRGTRYVTEHIERSVRFERSTFEGARVVLPEASHQCYSAPCGDVVLCVGERWQAHCSAQHVDGRVPRNDEWWVHDAECSRDLVYTRHEHNLMVTKQVTVQQTIGCFSFCFYTLDRRRLVLVQKRSSKVLMPYTTLCINNLGFWNAAEQCRGHVLVRFVVIDARQLSTRKRRRWAALMINDHFSTEQMMLDRVVFGETDDMFKITVRNL